MHSTPQDAPSASASVSSRKMRVAVKAALKNMCDSWIVQGFQQDLVFWWLSLAYLERWGLLLIISEFLSVTTMAELWFMLLKCQRGCFHSQAQKISKAKWEAPRREPQGKRQKEPSGCWVWLLGWWVFKIHCSWGLGRSGEVRWLIRQPRPNMTNTFTKALEWVARKSRLG